MRAVLQRVTRASVAVDDEIVGAIGAGLLILVGVAEGDGDEQARKLAAKAAGLRIHAGDEGRFDRSLIESGGQALVVSQFTLLADVRRGRRPSFTNAAAPEEAERLVGVFVDELRGMDIDVATGRFGADMRVDLENDGPVTLVLDSADLERPRRGS